MITLQQLTLGFNSRTLLNNCNATFEQGSLTALVGRNGAGKSTLLRVLAALDTPQAGDVIINNTPISSLNAEQRARLISFVSTQRVRVSNLKCKDVVAIGRTPYTNWMGSLQEQDKQCVAHALEAVGMTAFADRPIDTLSDGECQRIMIARALAQQTPIILLDEPTAFLDIPNRFEICRLLATLAHTENKTIIFSTHDIDAAMPVCDNVAILDNCALNIKPIDSAKELLNKLFCL
ncbi:MAG: ABC transporter ATP-binding protein [Alistipes sp.]|jgi:iron complex transport system ATP-binding protein|nr:ABC transporter ATP-binding protein [Alistipes sp.]